MTPPVQSARPIILGQSHVSRALGDARFFELLPEFRVLQAKLATMKIDLNSNRGCGGCKRARATANIFNDFLAITSTLSPDGLQRLKQYLGCQQFMVNQLNPQTGQVRLRIV